VQRELIFFHPHRPTLIIFKDNHHTPRLSFLTTKFSTNQQAHHVTHTYMQDNHHPTHSKTPIKPTLAITNFHTPRHYTTHVAQYIHDTLPHSKNNRIHPFFSPKQTNPRPSALFSHVFPECKEEHSPFPIFPGQTLT
jgi:hypothetical protein